MNILFISSWYPNSHFAYMGIFVKKHARAIKLAGGNIKVLAFVINKSDKLWDNKSRFFIDENGIETQLIEVNAKLYKILTVDVLFHKIFINKYLSKELSSFKPDIIHSNVLFFGGLLGHYVSKKFNVPLVMTEHWSRAGNYLQEGLYKGKARKALDHASMLMPVSSYLAGTFKGFIDEKKITVVPNVVDTDLYAYHDRKADPGKIVFACCANWVDPKRPDLFFEALEVYKKKSGKNFILHAIGGGDKILPLKEKKWSFDVNYYGFIEGEKIVEIFKQSDYLLHASGLETFSVALAESACMGIPRIASNAGATPELVNSENGILCENTIDSWVNAIEQIQTISFDRKKISESMREKVSMKSVGEKYMEIYRKVLSKQDLTDLSE
jgi:glycosyltransferase involved in cell wall biosynthesis